MAQLNEKETTDDVVREIRMIKEALAESLEYDIDRILEDARQKQREGDRQILSPPVRQDS